MCSWGKFWTKRYKKEKKSKNPTAISEEPEAKTGSESRVLYMPFALNTTKGWANHLNHPSL